MADAYGSSPRSVRAVLFGLRCRKQWRGSMSDRNETSGPVEILLVEDNPGDMRLTLEALKEGKVYSNLHWARDGVEALEFLRHEGKHAKAPRPDIILLDLNLPKKDGREVLSVI